MHLDQILTEVAGLVQKGQKPRLIFDLDSTVFDVSPRIAKIFHDFAANPTNQQRYPRQCQVLATVEPHPDDYGVKRTLQRYDFPLDDMSFFKVLVEFWMQGFFSNQYLKYDQPYEGVCDFISKANHAGADILYLTGRDIPRMLDGTLESLRQHGLPHDQKQLVMKPNSDVTDVEFKKQFFARLDSRPSWFFENEPANILIAMETAPKVNVIFVDTVHSGHGPLPPESVIRLKHWTKKT